jgi:hypothetical protein
VVGPVRDTGVSRTAGPVAHGRSGRARPVRSRTAGPLVQGRGRARTAVRPHGAGCAGYGTRMTTDTAPAAEPDVGDVPGADHQELLAGCGVGTVDRLRDALSERDTDPTG